MDLDCVIEKFALANAAKFNGKAVQGSVISHVVGELPEAKKDMKATAKRVGEVISRVNKLSVEEQIGILKAKYPEMLEKREHEEHDIFAFLNINEGDIVKTGFPPGPEKYPHLGHGKAILLNYLLAKRYGGKFILRFEDTNPELVRAEFYDIMQENFKWLGVEWDELQCASDHMLLFYEFAEKIISSGNAYICTCEVELMRDNRSKGLACNCRERSPQENFALWRELPNMKAGAAVLRLKIDLMHENSTMRDPTIFRIIDTPHARQGTKFRVWPNYDFQNAIMDGYFKLTHRLRSKEFEMRSELQRYIQKLLGLSITTTYEFGRFNMVGVELSGRIIREKINKGELIGWDDPELATIVALRRRGFTPEALMNFVLSTGITKSEAVLKWDDLIVHNKRVLDENADRMFFVNDPVRIFIRGAPSLDVELHKHPTHRRGGRNLKTKDEFFITKEDFLSFKDGELYRLMDCLNFVKRGDDFFFDSVEHEKYKARGKKIIQYLPVSDDLVKVQVLMPDKKVLTGFGEQAMRDLLIGDIIQSERFGYMRLDHKEKDKLVFWFTHQ
jgi:glutamyl-tRNA synthetase